MSLDRNAESSTSLPENCTKIHGSGSAMTDCSSYSWGTVINGVDGECTPQAYTGSVCWQQLLAWQECTGGAAEDVFLDSASKKLSQEERERDVARFLHFLRKLAHEYTTSCLNGCFHSIVRDC